MDNHEMPRLHSAFFDKRTVIVKSDMNVKTHKKGMNQNSARSCKSKNHFAAKIFAKHQPPKSL